MKTNRSRYTIPLILVVLLGLAWQGAELYLSPISYDEVVTLLVATGHAVCLPSFMKPDAAYGDFVETDQFLPSKQWKQYSQFPPEGMTFNRLMRAIALSDSHPPFYCILVSHVLQIFGASKCNLRLISLFFGFVTLPFIWLIGRRLAGKTTAFFAVILFWLNPIVIHYSVEGRMYSLVIFLASAEFWLLLRCHDQGWNRVRFFALTAIAVIGMMTHYFFLSFLAGSWLWLLLKPGQSDRKILLLHCVLALACCAPWYLTAIPYGFHHDGTGPGYILRVPVPLLVEYWSVSKLFLWQAGYPCLDIPTLKFSVLEILRVLILLPLWGVVSKYCAPIKQNTAFAFCLAPFMILATALSFIFPPAQVAAYTWLPIITLALAASVSILYLIFLAKFPVAQYRHGNILLLLVLVALSTSLVPVALDVLLKMRLSSQVRYELLAIIPAIFFLALALSQFKKSWQISLIILVVLDSAGLTAIEIASGERSFTNLPAMGDFIEKQDKQFPILSHIDSYMNMCLAREIADDRLLATWYDGREGIPASRPKHLKPTEDIVPMIRERPGLIFIHWRWAYIHDNIPPVEAWLRAHAHLRQVKSFPAADILIFTPQDGTRFLF